MGVSSRKFYLIVTAGLLALCLMAGIFSLNRISQTRRSASASGTLTAQPKATLTPGALSEPPRGGNTASNPASQAASNFPAAVRAELDTLEEQVIEVRGQNRLFTVPRKLISPAEMRERLSTRLDREYTAEEQQAEELLAGALGLLTPGQDLREIYLDLWNEGVTSLYNPADKIIYTVKSSNIGMEDRLSFVHEYARALQDQHFNLLYGLRYNDAACQNEVQRCTVLHALLEGDTTLTTQQWQANFAAQGDSRQAGSQAAGARPAFDSAPAYFQKDFMYPYEAGLGFVLHLWRRGGWQAVDAVYENPPVSSEQILHPDHYPDDEPRPVRLPQIEPLLGAGWKTLVSDTLGEWYTYLALAYGDDPAARTSDNQARQAASGWEGDQYALFSGPQGQSVFVMIQLWDVPRDAAEFLAAMRITGTARWGEPANDLPYEIRWETPRQAVTLISNNTYTFWVQSPDINLTAEIANLLQTP